jgi:hypothetical protein
MKKYLSIVLLFICITKFYGQDTDFVDKRSFEISANLTSFRYFPELVGKNKFKLTPPNGLNLNIMKNKCNHYIGINYFLFKEQIVEIQADGFNGTGKYKAFGLYYGVYHDFDLNKIKIGLGIDLYNSFSNYKADFTGGFDGRGINYSRKYYRIGLRPSFILKYELNSNISFFIKESGEIEYITPSVTANGNVICFFDCINSFGISLKIN